MILYACINALNMVGLSLALFGLPMIAHFVRFRFMCAHSAIFWILLIWSWRWFMLSARMVNRLHMLWYVVFPIIFVVFKVGILLVAWCDG